ncbi:MAG: hypothetical protein V1659_01555 [Candidatus Woesearchaeota archaeon]
MARLRRLLKRVLESKHVLPIVENIEQRLPDSVLARLNGGVSHRFSQQEREIYRLLGNAHSVLNPVFRLTTSQDADSYEQIRSDIVHQLAEYREAWSPYFNSLLEQCDRHENYALGYVGSSCI